MLPFHHVIVGIGREPIMSQNKSYELFADNGLFSPCNLTDNGRTGNTEEIKREKYQKWKHVKDIILKFVHIIFELIFLSEDFRLPAASLDINSLQSVYKFYCMFY